MPLPFPFVIHLHINFACPPTPSKAKQLDCDATLPGNLGCGVAAPEKNSYGPEFNKAGGGFYIMERTPTAINAWFFTRGANVSAAITSGAPTLDTATLVGVANSLKGKERMLNEVTGYTDCDLPKYGMRLSHTF